MYRLGEKLLAGAALAGDKHIAVPGGDAPRKLLCVFELRAVAADNIVEREEGAAADKAAGPALFLLDIAQAEHDVVYLAVLGDAYRVHEIGFAFAGCVLHLDGAHVNVLACFGGIERGAGRGDNVAYEMAADMRRIGIHKVTEAVVHKRDIPVLICKYKYGVLIVAQCLCKFKRRDIVRLCDQALVEIRHEAHKVQTCFLIRAAPHDDEVVLRAVGVDVGAGLHGEKDIGL